MSVTEKDWIMANAYFLVQNPNMQKLTLPSMPETLSSPAEKETDCGSGGLLSVNIQRLSVVLRGRKCIMKSSHLWI